MNNWMVKNKHLFQGKIVAVSPIDIGDEFEFVQYKDARSAAFYAMGSALKESRRITLMVPGQYISSIYTAVTEAWFQKADITVIAFYHKVSDVNTQWFDRCLQMHATYGMNEEGIRGYLEKSKSVKGPILLNVVGCKVNEKLTNYDGIVDILKQVDSAKESFICYNPSAVTDAVKPIHETHKYGIVSKYIGMSIVKDQGYLLCNAECLVVDVNVFRSRYANKNMKIIVLDDGTIKENNIASWIESNNWLCRRVEELDIETAKWFISNDKQTVLIVG